MILQEMTPMDLIFRHFQGIGNISILNLYQCCYFRLGYNAQISLSGHFGTEQYQV
jgi:hypothetical protein